MSVSVVVQRFRECKLLLLEERYVTVGGSDDSCGVLAYVSFASSTTIPQVEQAAQTLLNLPVLTTGLWGDGESSTLSILTLASEESSSCSLVIVPQANLISKVKQGGRSIQYHGQIKKERGQELYECFCDCLRGKLLEAQCTGNSKELPEWYRTRQAFFEQQNNNNKQSSRSPSTPPDQFFRDEEKYSEWDESGFPIKDVEANELTKSQMKKLKKMYEAHSKKHIKWKEQNEGDKGTGVIIEKEQGSGPPPSQWEDSLDPSFCHFIAGSFGKRQGLEFRSDMGPFVHTFEI